MGSPLKLVKGDKANQEKLKGEARCQKRGLNVQESPSEDPGPGAGRRISNINSLLNLEVGVQGTQLRAPS